MCKQIKMIVMDFDWTLIDHSGKNPKIEQELIDYLSAYIAAGNQAGIVSGRNSWEMKEMFERIGYDWGKPFPSFFICREAYIYLVEQGSAMTLEKYNDETKKRTLALMRRLALYVDDWMNSLEQKGLTIANWNIFGNFALELHMKTKEEAQLAIEVLEDCISKSGMCDCQVHRNGVMATVLDANSGKGNALKKAIEFFNVKPTEVLAIGDSLNDKSMIDGKIGYIGGCVGNGEEILKQAVKTGGGYIGAGIASVGVMDIINQLIRIGNLKKL